MAEGFTLEAAKKAFFDRAGVADKIGRAKRRAFSKFGAFVRQRARTSIRKRKGASAPGGPPSSHVGLLRKGILFAFDRDRESVVIGPVLLGSRSGAPERLEKGGTGLVGPKKKRRTATYAPRPYMRPALAAELAKVPDHLRDMIH